MELSKLSQIEGASPIVSYCLAHKQPIIRPPSDCTLVELGPKSSVSSEGFSRKINAYDLCGYGSEMHSYLGGTLGSFAVLRDLETRNLHKSTRVNIVHYRRVLLPKRLGVLAPNYPDMRLLTPEAASALSLDEVYAKISTPALYSKPQRIKSTLRQYDKCHSIADLLRFLAAAVQVGAIDGSEINALLTDRSIIPGGIEFGVSPVRIYMETVKKLEDTCLAFLQDHRPYDTSAYQVRALNFCSERLGSYLLKKELANTYGRRMPRRLYGYMHVVGDRGTYEQGT